ncbi:putative RNA-directed DNA polymerase [Tanacetum coccineum]
MLLDLDPKFVHLDTCLTYFYKKQGILCVGVHIFGLLYSYFVLAIFFVFNYFALWLLRILVLVRKKEDASGSNSELNLHVNDPLFLNANDSNGTPLITFKLTGTNNYKIWVVAVHLALHTNTLGFINGKCVRDESNVLLQEQWDRCNSDEFKETYDEIDSSVIYNLHYKICSLTQYGSSLSEYYRNYNSLKRQFDSLVDFPSCSCDSASKLKDHKDLMRLMQFLMGLDDTYNVVRSQILTTEPLLDVKFAFATLSRVESHKNNLVHSSPTKPSSSAFVSRLNNCSSVKSDQSAANTLPFTTDQINGLMALIGSKPDSEHLYDIIDVSHVKITISHPNGTIEMVKHVGNYKLLDKITLKEVLMVPGYKVSLLFIHKLGKDDKFVVSFAESICFVYDSLQNSLMDKIQLDSLSDIQPYDVCHKTKQIMEPFPLSDHKTNYLVIKSNEPYDDKRNSRLGDSDGINKSPDFADVSTDTSPTVTSHIEEVVTESPSRHSNSNPDGLRSSGASPKGDDATLYDDEYDYEGEDFVDFNQLFESDQDNNPEGSVLRRYSRQHKMPA